MDAAAAQLRVRPHHIRRLIDEGRLATSGVDELGWPMIDAVELHLWAEHQRAIRVELDGKGGFFIRLTCPDGRVRLFKARGQGVVPRPQTRAPLPPGLRFEILQRDHFTCRYCGRKAPDVTLHVDHVLALANGGSSDPSNLVTACADCNLGKSDATGTDTLDDFSH